MIRNLCIEKNGKASECANCGILARGFCERFLEVLEKIARDLERRYTGVSVGDREEIMANTVEGVLGGIDGFEGRRGAGFSTWVWRIYRNKVSDYFRRENRNTQYNLRILQEPAGLGSGDDEEIRIAVAECFEKHLQNDGTGCVRLYLDLYRYFKAGKTRKDLAESYGLKPNTLVRRLGRCRKVIRRLFAELLQCND